MKTFGEQLGTFGGQLETFGRQLGTFGEQFGSDLASFLGTNLSIMLQNCLSTVKNT